MVKLPWEKYLRIFINLNFIALIFKLSYFQRLKACQETVQEVHKYLVIKCKCHSKDWNYKIQKRSNF